MQHARQPEAKQRCVIGQHDWPVMHSASPVQPATQVRVPSQTPAHSQTRSPSQSSVPGAHSQRPTVEHTRPVPHTVPGGSIMSRQPPDGSQDAEKQGPSVVHTMLPVPGWQCPALQRSPVVHAFPSLHEAPVFAVRVQRPVVWSHASSVQGSPSLQSSVPVDTQAPLAQ